MYIINKYTIARVDTLEPLKYTPCTCTLDVLNSNLIPDPMKMIYIHTCIHTCHICIHVYSSLRTRSIEKPLHAHMNRGLKVVTY